MKRILMLAVLAATMVCVMNTPSDAAGRKAKRHSSANRTMAAATCPVSDPSRCPWPCQAGEAASASTAMVPARAASGERCNLSDPSACPSPCRKTAGATAVAASVTKK